jgi:hypothetical protein
MLRAIYPIVVFIFLNTPVASVQLDIQSEGEIQLLAGKQLHTAPIPGGHRIIIFDLSQDTLSGHILTIDGRVSQISGVVAANPDATRAQVDVMTLHSPETLRIK